MPPRSRPGGSGPPPPPANPYEVQELRKGLAGFVDELDYVEVHGGCKLAARCQFLDWKKVKAADSGFGVESWAAPHSLVACITSSGARPASDDADEKRWDEDAGLIVSDFTVETLSAHGQILGELGLFNKDYKDFQVYQTDLITALKKLADPGKMLVKAAGLQDYVPYSAADANSESDDGSGRGTKRPSVTGRLRWLQELAPGRLIQAEAALPSAVLLRAWVILIGRHNPGTRADKRSKLQAGAKLLKEAAARQSALAKPDEDDLAEALCDDAEKFLIFPRPAFRLKRLSYPDCLSEFKDSLRYDLGPAEQADKVIADRMLLSKRAFPDVMSVFEDLASVGERIAQFERLSLVACPGRHAQAIDLRLPSVQEFVAGRHALVTEAKSKGKTGTEVVDLLLADAAEHPTGGSAAASKAGVGDEDEDGREKSGHGLTARVWESVFASAAYVALRSWYDNEPANLLDEAKGRKALLVKCYGSGCAIFPAAAARPQACRGRDILLSAFINARTAESAYAGAAQAMGANGKVADGLKGWVWHISQTKLLAAGNLEDISWLNPPYGALGMQNLLRVSPYQPVPVGQQYSVDSAIEAMADFAHATMVAFGGPETSTTGYTFASWGKTQRDYVKWISQQSDDAQTDLLEHAEEIGALAMTLMGAEFRQFKATDRPHVAKLPHLMAFDEGYDLAIEEKKEAAKPLVTVQRAFPHMRTAGASRSLPGVVPADGIASTPKLEGGVSLAEKPGGGGEPLPGSKKSWCKWQDDGQLRIANDLMDVVRYGKEQLGLEKDAISKLCWPVIACRSQGKSKLAFCPCPNDEGHRGVMAALHKEPKGFDRAILFADYSKKVKYGGPGSPKAKLQQKLAKKQKTG